ncbi:hypothetical protein RRG08_040790 [Elysia crispata]|uniref:Uncharacterized protein n=1 Tax=Elysia crispata TaxID=231223 RepID=A0AAE1EGK4_9GAST|nr:hypothetical protein RRG08_040790 [Elysia crispata]
MKTTFAVCLALALVAAAACHAPKTNKDRSFREKVP